MHFDLKIVRAGNEHARHNLGDVAFANRIDDSWRRGSVTDRHVGGNAKTKRKDFNSVQVKQRSVIHEMPDAKVPRRRGQPSRKSEFRSKVIGDHPLRHSATCAPNAWGDEASVREVKDSCSGGPTEILCISSLQPIRPQRVATSIESEVLVPVPRL